MRESKLRLEVHKEKRIETKDQKDAVGRHAVAVGKPA
jgi:hypothetical protein